MARNLFGGPEKGRFSLVDDDDDDVDVGFNLQNRTEYVLDASAHIRRPWRLQFSSWRVQCT